MIVAGVASRIGMHDEIETEDLSKILMQDLILEKVA